MNTPTTNELIEGDAHIRSAVARLTLAKNRGDESSASQAYRQVIRLMAIERQVARRNFIEGIAGDEETNLLLNFIGRALVLFRRNGGDYEGQRKQFERFMKPVSRALGEDATPGSTYVIEKLGSDLFDLLTLNGAWATLGVRVLRSKSTKFPIMTTFPTAQFVLTEAGPLPEDSALAGSSLSAEAEVLAALIPVSMQLWDDLDVDIAAQLLEAFERGCNARLEYACFAGTGAADGDNGSMTGIFTHADVPSTNAAAGNTTIESLDENDWLNAFLALPAGALQRGPAAWAHPHVILRAMKNRDAANRRCVKTALESDTGGALFSVAGFPLHATASAPSTNAAATKVAAVGAPDAYLVGIRKEFVCESSDHAGWTTFQRCFRCHMRVRGVMRQATGFNTIKTAAV